MKKLLALLILFVVFGCKDKGLKGNAIDADIKVWALKLKADKEGLSYNIRIYPDQKFTQGNLKLSEQMMYRADSCFYLLDGQNKIYPLSTEYVAAGSSKYFEYLVSFGYIKNEKGQSMPLIYQDKYMNKKNYQIGFK
ncbi:hypothetical protein ACXZ1K_05265 [Pedobacter sp. PWIIR3]